jgi:hypothetical protein
MRFWRFLSLVAGLVVALAVVPAHADNARSLQSRIQALGTVPQARELAANAEQNLARAAKLTDVGDTERARLALGAAEDWTAAGEALTLTLESERAAQAIAANARSKQTLFEKLRVEVEALLARLGRVRPAGSP